MSRTSNEDKEWSQNVIEQFKDSTETLPAIDEPSGFQKRLIHGSALVNAGATIADASRECGVSYMQLHSFHKGKLKTVPPEVKAEQENAIREQAVEGLMKAQEKIITRIDSDDIRTSELVKAAQTLRDTVSTLDNWKERGTGGGEATKDALKELVQGVLNRIPSPDPVQEAVEVSAVQSPEESEEEEAHSDEP